MMVTIWFNSAESWLGVKVFAAAVISMVCRGIEGILTAGLGVGVGGVTILPKLPEEEAVGEGVRLPVAVTGVEVTVGAKMEIVGEGVAARLLVFGCLWLV